MSVTLYFLTSHSNIFGDREVVRKHQVTTNASIKYLHRLFSTQIKCSYRCRKKIELEKIQK